MKNVKSTKYALLSGVVAILLCVAMLVGTTLAWFTDSASTAVNRIQAGTLDVALEMKVGDTWVNAEGTTLGWVAADGRAQDNLFWEPGCTYNLNQFRIVNNGNLALKYKVAISGFVGDSPLFEVIDFTVSGVSGVTTVNALNGFEGELAAASATDAITISGHMRDSAGNEYQGLSINGIVITVVAKQATGYEYDSNGGIYDTDAEYAVVDANELTTALASGGIVTIDNDIIADATKSAVSDRITINAPTALNLDAKFIVPGELEPTSNWAGLYIAADTVINATEAGGIQCIDKASGGCGTYVAHITGGANVTVNGGTYYGGGTTFQVQEGTLTINGGHFEVTSFGEPYTYNFLLNCIDTNYQDGTAKIIVKGGTFVNFNPADNSAEGANTNFVADGYTVVSATQSNGDIWYTVVPQ